LGQALQPQLIVAVHPVAQRLAVHCARLGRSIPRSGSAVLHTAAGQRNDLRQGARKMLQIESELWDK
jgi:hypothetical protein